MEFVILAYSDIIRGVIVKSGSERERERGVKSIQSLSDANANPAASVVRLG